MTQDRRFAARRLVRVDVIINHDFEAGLWKTRNLSLDGALVEMPPETLPLRAEVEAILALPDRGQLEHYHVAARVVRTEVAGVALAFRDYGIAAYTRLAELLQEE